YRNVYRSIAPPDRRGSGNTMQLNDKRLPSRGYVGYLAGRLSDAEKGSGADRGSHIEAELEWLRARMRSPRHRIAEWLANLLPQTPVVWPAVSWVTEAVLRWENRRATRVNGSARHDERVS